MKKFLPILGLLLFSVVTLLAQERVVSGTVTDQTDGSTLPGVNVLLKGTSTGAVTDVNGEYKISVPEAGGVLVFSSIGFKTQEVEVGSQSTIDVGMSLDVTELAEVVVTALNVDRDKKTLGYATQEIQSENLRVARETNLNQALAGKVAGVQIISGSGAKFGEAAIRIRGIRGLGGAAPLYVLDGIIINDISSINMDNVGSINVLKGANASALYGIRASDGVVMMTSKSAKEGVLSISLNNTTTFENVSRLPDYQNEYGGGYSSDFGNVFTYVPGEHDPALQGLDGYPYPEFYADESWGPKLDGTLVAQWDAFTPGTEGYGKPRPWSPNPNNVKDFYETGVSVNNSVNVSTATDKFGFNATVTDIRRSGVLPNTSQKRNYLNLGVNVKLADNLNLKVTQNYSRINTYGNLVEGYGLYAANGFSQWFQRQLDIKLLEKYWKMPDGSYTSWNINSPTDLQPLYWNNPYTDYYANVRESSREISSSSANLEYEVTEGLKLIASATRDSRVTEALVTEASGTLSQDFFGTGSDIRREDNYSLNATYNNTFNDKISVQGILGYNFMDRIWRGQSIGTSGGLSVPDLYNIGSSIDRPAASNYRARLQNESIYISGNAGYNEMFYVEGLYRRDWTSAIVGEKGKNLFDYYQFSSSFIFSEILPENDIISFGKLRGSIAQGASEIDPYFNATTFSTGTPYGSYATMSQPDILIDPDLRATVTLSKEIGLELKFLRNKLTLDMSYYNYDTKGQALTLGIPSETGVSGYRTNDGQFETKGWEVAIGGTPVETNDLKWSTNFNFSGFTVDVIKLDEEGLLEAIPLENGFRGTGTTGSWGGVQARAQKGEEWGTIYGNAYKRDANGNKIMDADGFPLREKNQNLGSILPDFTGGIFNRIEYKDFVFSFTFDWQLGGKVYSVSNQWMNATGLTTNTTGNNDKGNPKRDAVADGGGMTYGGVFEDGTPNNIYVEANDYYWSIYSLHEEWLYNATYLKLREVRLGYNLPSSMLSKTPFKSVSVNLVSNNTLLLFADLPGFDPSEISGDTQYSRTNGAWSESGNLPPTRTMGFDFKFGF